MGYVTEVDEWAERCVSDPQWVADCLHRLHRFGGQHPESTVCRHSLEVWWMCSQLAPAEQLWALIHDAHEILSGEITRHYKADETAKQQQYADIILRSALGLCEVDLAAVHVADVKHGEQEWRALNDFHAGEITGRQLYGMYIDCPLGVTNEWVHLFEILRGKI